MNFKNVDIGKFVTYRMLIEKGSFAKATEFSGASYSSLYHEISSLEKSLNKKLYYPTKRQFVPTKEGVELLNVFEKFMDELSNTFENQSNIIIDSLSIKSTITMNKFFVIPTIKEIHNNYIGTKFITISGISDPDRIEFDSDILICESMKNRGDVSKRDLFISKYGFIASKSYIEIHGKPESLKEFKGYDLLLFSGKHLLSDKLLKQNNIKLESNSYLDLLEACFQGQGLVSFPLSILPSIKETEPDRFKKIIRILPEYISETEVTSLYYKKTSHKHELILDFYKNIKKIINISEEKKVNYINEINI